MILAHSLIHVGPGHIHVGHERRRRRRRRCRHGGVASFVAHQRHLVALFQWLCAFHFHSFCLGFLAHVGHLQLGIYVLKFLRDFGSDHSVDLPVRFPTLLASLEPGRHGNQKNVPFTSVIVEFLCLPVTTAFPMIDRMYDNGKLGLFGSRTLRQIVALHEPPQCFQCCLFVRISETHHCCSVWSTVTGALLLQVCVHYVCSSQFQFTR